MRTLDAASAPLPRRCLLCASAARADAGGSVGTPSEPFVFACDMTVRDYEVCKAA